MGEKEAKKKHVRAAIGVVIRDNKLLICQRKSDAILGGYWEFPGGKIEPDETPAQAVIRELNEELGIYALPTRILTILRHEYAHAHVELHPFLCQITQGQPQTLGCQAFLWVEPQELSKYQFPEANGPLIEEIRQILGQ